MRPKIQCLGDHLLKHASLVEGASGWRDHVEARFFVLDNRSFDVQGWNNHAKGGEFI